MKRRVLLASTAAVALSPGIAPAQQKATPVVGFLSSQAQGEMVASRIAGYRKGLAEQKFVEGENVRVEYLWAEGHYDRLPSLAAELVRRRVDVIAAAAQDAALAAKAATSNIPIVFNAGGDPVRLGLVASFSRPGGNVTGISMLTTELEAKRLGLLHDMVPKAAPVGVLLNPPMLVQTTR